MSVVSEKQLLGWFDCYGGGPPELRDEGNWIVAKRVTPEIRKRLADIIAIPSRIQVPIIPTKDRKCGIFEYEPATINEEQVEQSANRYFLDLAYEEGFSIFDFHWIYVENSYPDRDGAGLLLNVNLDSPLFGRVVVYHSCDDAYFSLLADECDLDRVLEEYDTFQPDEESPERRLSYFVDHLSHKYEEASSSH